MKRYLAILLSCLSIGLAQAATNEEVIAAVPKNEGQVVLVANEAFLWRTVPARTYSGLINSCILGCPKAEGSLAITKDALIFIVGGKPIFRMKRSDIDVIETEKYGRSRFLFITNRNYETIAIQTFGQETIQPVADELNIKWVDN
jgi:hypothetical protein